jgi:Glycosyl hydrolase family 62
MKAPLLLLTILSLPLAAAEPAWLTSGIFHWKCLAPLIEPHNGGDDPDVALKDPSIVFHEGRWHLFGTHRRASGKVAMQYLTFTDWSVADRAERHPLRFMETYHCAPQVFYFTPHRKWYLIYQAASDWHRTGATLPEHFTLAPVFSTTTDLADPRSWTAPEPMIVEPRIDGKRPRWIDFWVICDARKAHLFYTSDDGHFWRRETAKENFPRGWSAAELVLKDTKEALFEASHTYKLKGRDQYLTIIEALGKGHRYYKAWLADQLEGPWRPLATTAEKPFASVALNVTQPAPPWTTSISHGELLRSSNDETLEVDPERLRFVFQGVDAAGYSGNKYGGIPWRLGILDLMPD